MAVVGFRLTYYEDAVTDIKCLVNEDSHVFVIRFHLPHSIPTIRSSLSFSPTRDAGRRHWVSSSTRIRTISTSSSHSIPFTLPSTASNKAGAYLQISPATPTEPRGITRFMAVRRRCILESSEKPWSRLCLHLLIYLFQVLFQYILRLLLNLLHLFTMSSFNYCCSSTSTVFPPLLSLLPLILLPPPPTWTPLPSRPPPPGLPLPQAVSRQRNTQIQTDKQTFISICCE